MKRIFSLIMALCLLFCGVLPAFAAETGTGSAAVVDSGISDPALGESGGSGTPSEAAPSEEIAPLSDFTGGGTEFYTKIRLTVTDRDGNPIPGAVYGLYSSADDRLIETLTTDENGVATTGDVPMETDYYVEELSTPEGFQPNSGRHEINLTEVCAPSRIDVTVEYDPIMGRIKVIKTDEDGTPLADVGFQVYRESPWELVDDITTTADGSATTIDLPYGDYELSEYNVPDGLAADSWYYASITEHDATAEYTIVNYPAKGDLKITKTGNDGKSIPGAVFEIYNADTGALAQEITTNGSGYVWSSYMPLGNYYAVEKSVPAPYKLDTTRHDFSLTYHYQSVYLNIENVVDGDPGTVKIIKTDDSGNPLSGVSFALYRAWDSKKLSTLTSGADGTAVSGELIPGGYYLLETTGVPGYTMETGQIPFTIDGSGAVVEKTVVNPKIRVFGNVKVIKKDDAGNPVEGARFGVYCDRGNLLEELTTAADGTAASGALNEGSYYLLELEAPEGYLADEGQHPFTISQNGVTVPVSVTNQRISGKVKVIKTGEDGETLNGVKFGIYDAATDRQISSMTTDWWGEAESGTLYYGNYYLKELKAADGYELIDTPIPFSISEPGVVLEIPVTNPMIVGGISVLKLSGEPEEIPSEGGDFRYWGEVEEEHQPLSGAVFGIYTEWGQKIAEMVSDENGEASYFGLPQGYFYLKELTAPEGYILIDELIPFGIYEQGDIREWVVYNPEGFGTIEVQKSGEDGALPSVAFDVYRAATDEKVGSLVTDAEGIASLELPLGRYYLVEAATAPGYALLTGRVSFTLTVDGATVELPILNQKAQIGCDKGQIKVLKRDADSDKLLPGASFAICRVTDEAKVGEVVTGTDGTAMSQSIPAGDYYLLELRAPSGFEIGTVKHPVTVTVGETIEVTITNKRLPEEPSEPDQSATLKLLKVDAADSKIPLSSAVFGIYATEGGAKVGELLTDQAGAAAMTLPEGDYILRELEAPEGYKLSGDSVSLHLKAGETKELTVKNSKSEPEKPEPPTPAKPGTLRIIKVDSDDGKKLADAVFGVFNADTDKQIDTLTTGKSGAAELSLPAGDYYLRELETPKGYTLKKTDVNFHLESGAVRELTVKNTPEAQPEKTGLLRLLKEDAKTGDPLKNAVFGVYDRDDALVEEITTGRGGIAELELPVGSYYLRELEAPKGYIRDRSKVTFKITEDKTTRVTVENDREKSDPIRPEQPKPETPKPEQPKPTPTPSQPETPKPAPTQPGASKPSPSKPAPSESSGTLRLVKLAAGSGAPLPGAVFGVYAQTGEKLTELTSGADGTATLSLPMGRYVLKEQRAPYGYKPETARIRAEVLQNKTTIVEVTNELDPDAPPMPEINVPQTGIPFPTMSYAAATLLFGLAALCGAMLIRSRKRAQ